MIEIRLNGVDFWVSPIGEKEDKQLGLLDPSTGIKIYVLFSEEAVEILKQNIKKPNKRLRKEIEEALEKEAAEASSEALKEDLEEK